MAEHWAEHRERVRPEWVDAQGTLAPAYAVVIFDHAIDRLYNGIGLGDDYRRETSFSTFTLETHALHERPVPAGEEVRVLSRVLDVDAKRMHIAQEMFGADGRVALLELVSIHVDLAQRRSAPFPPERFAQVHEAMRSQADRPKPAGIGQEISLTGE